MNWISIDWQYPESETEVLCYGKYVDTDYYQIAVVQFYATQAMIKNGHVKYYWELPTRNPPTDGKPIEGYHGMIDVTHWMPLPKLPKD
jgi:hypothetical protein